MDNAQLWKEYRALQGTADTAHTVEVLQRCINESSDQILAYCAGRDLGVLYTNGPAGVADKGKAEKVLEDAAWLAMMHGYEHPDQYDEIACQTLAQLLYQEGNMRSFAYFMEAVKLGSVISAQTLYRELNERGDNNAFDKLVKDNIRENIATLYSECTEAISEEGSAAAAKGVPQFALALVGLYELGAAVGIDREQGMAYLRASQQLGNGHAKQVAEISELQDPRKLGPVLQDPQRLNELLQRMQGGAQAAPAQPQPQKARQAKQPKKKKKFPVWLIVLLAVLVIAWLARDWIVATVTGLISALSGVLAVAFLLVCLYIYSEDGDSSPMSQQKNPLDEYKASRNPANLPDYVYDDANKPWRKTWCSETECEFVNDDGQTVHIYHCNISGDGAETSAGWLHW